MLSKGKIVKDQYKIMDILGRGGQGSVYRAYDMKKGYYERAEVALKEIRRGKDLMSDMVNIDFFRQEVQILAKLRHPYLPRIFDAFNESGNFYIVEEYIEGKTLENFLVGNGKLAPKKSVELAIRIADILDYLHQQDPPIYYRDLKPANLIMQPGRLYLIDFSGCYIPMMGFGEGVAVRTRGYCPPEAYNTSKADPAFDVYTLGMVLYQMVTGENAGQFTGPPPPLNPAKEGIPPKLAEIIHKATKRSKLQRYHTIWEMKLDLERMEEQLKETPTPAVKEGEKPPPPKTPAKFAMKDLAKKILLPLLDIMVFLLIPLMPVRAALSKIIPFARSEAAFGWIFYVMLAFILIIHLSTRHFLDFLEPVGRYSRYLHFPVRNYLDIRPIKWLFVLEVFMVVYIYFKFLTM